MAKGLLMGGLTALALAVVVVAYTVVASKLDRWWITGAMVLATGVILGPGGLDVLPFFAGQRDGPYHHRADPGPAAVLRCLHGPAAGG